MAKIPYRDRITFTTPSCNPIPEASVNIPVLAEIKLWREKFYHLENPNDAAGNPHVGKGDDISFILVFGNDGELPCPASPPTTTPPFSGNPSVEDTLEIQSPVKLKLMSLCIGDEYELWVVRENGVDLTNPYQVLRCHIFQSGIYTLQLRKKRIDDLATPYFEIPCHYICCVAMLFQLEFPACPPCENDCEGRPIRNGSFEIGPHTINNIPEWTLSMSPNGNPFAQEVTSFGLYTPVDSNHFALLKVDGSEEPTSISQTISVCPGDKIEGYAFFLTNESEETEDYNDYADIKIYDSLNNLVATPFAASVISTGTTNWTYWSYNFIQGGTYTLVGKVSNVGDDTIDSYLGLDAIRIV